MIESLCFLLRIQSFFLGTLLHRQQIIDNNRDIKQYLKSSLIRIRIEMRMRRHDTYASIRAGFSIET